MSSAPRTSVSSSSSSSSSKREVVVGDRVIAGPRKGYVRFKGETKFAAGVWVGVELEVAEGKNDGSVQGVRYFECPPNCGLFVKSSMVKLDTEGDSTPTPTPSPTPTITINTVNSTTTSSAPSVLPPATPTGSGTQQSAIPSVPSTVPVRKGSTSTAKPTTTATTATKAPNTLAAPTSTPTPTPSPAPSTEARKSVIAKMEKKMDLQQAPPQSLERDINVITSPSSSSSPSPSAVVATPAKPTEERKSISSTSAPAVAISSPKLTAASSPLPSSSSSKTSTPPTAAPSSTSSSSTVSATPSASSGVSLEEYRQVKNDLSKSRLTIEQLKGEIASLKKENESFSSSNDISQLQGMIEMLTLDKSLAEEQVEELTNDLENTKERMQSMQIELSSLRDSQSSSKDEILRSLSSSDADTVKLMEQNKQLTLALKQLRDVSVGEKSKFASQIASMEKELRQSHGEHEEFLKLKKTISKYEEDLSSLREQLDEAADLHSLVEQLSEKNLSLSETNEKLSNNIKYLQALNEASEDVEEGHIELESQLQQELQIKEMDIQDLTLKLKYKISQNDDQQKTIRQFRELVRHQEMDAKAMKEQQIMQQVVQADKESGGVGGSTSGGFGLNKTAQLLLQNRLKEVRNKNVDQQLYRIDADQFKRKSDFTALYIPDNISMDERSLHYLMLIDRLKAKNEVILSTLHEYYGGGASTSTSHSSSSASSFSSLIHSSFELSSLAYQICSLLIEISKLCDVLLYCVQQCDSATYNASAAHYKDILPCEVIIDAYINMVQQDTMNENSSLLSLFHCFTLLAQFLFTNFNVIHSNLLSQQQTPHQWLVIPFSVELFSLSKKFQPTLTASSTASSSSSPSAPSADDSQLAIVLKNIESKSITVSPSAPLFVLLECRQLLYKSYNIHVHFSSIEDLLATLRAAKKEGKERERMKLTKDSSAADSIGNKMSSLLSPTKDNKIFIGDSSSADDEDYDKLFNNLQDLHLNSIQICTQIINNARSYEMVQNRIRLANAKQKASNENSEGKDKEKDKEKSNSQLNEIHRLLYVSLLRAHRCQLQTQNVLAKVKSIVTPEKISEIKQYSQGAYATVTSALSTLLTAETKERDEVRDRDEDPSLFHEMDQFKGGLLELTRQLMVDEKDKEKSNLRDEESTNTPITYPYESHAATTRQQLQQAAAVRIQLQEMNAKLAEKQRELLTLKTTNSELTSKLSILQQKITSLQSKAEGGEEMKNQIENFKTAENGLKDEIAKLTTEIDNINRENKTLKKQLLKLKHKVLQQGEQQGATGTNAGANAPFALGVSSSLSSSTTVTVNTKEGSTYVVSSDEIRGMESTIKMLRAEIISMRSAHAAAVVKSSLPPLTSLYDFTPNKVTENDQLRTLKGQVERVREMMANVRAAPKIVDITQKGLSGKEREAVEKKQQGGTGMGTGEEKKGKESSPPPPLPPTTPFQQYLSVKSDVHHLDSLTQRLGQSFSLFVGSKKAEQWRTTYASVPTHSNIKKIVAI